MSTESRASRTDLPDLARRSADASFRCETEAAHDLERIAARVGAVLALLVDSHGGGIIGLFRGRCSRMAHDAARRWPLLIAIAEGISGAPVPMLTIKLLLLAVTSRWRRVGGHRFGSKLRWLAESGPAGSRKDLGCSVMTVEVLSNEDPLLLGRLRRPDPSRVSAVRGVNDDGISGPLGSPDGFIDCLVGTSG